MKVYIGPYKNWYGPHQLAETLCFWAKKTVVDEHGMKDYPDYVFKFGELLAHGKWRGIDDIPSDPANPFKYADEKKTVLYRLLEWIESKRDRKIKIRIDKYDTWSMDHTLALIALPMLKQLKETNHGSAQVDDEDLPEHMRLYSYEDSYYGDQQVFDFYDDPDLCRQNIKCDIHDKWNWVMDEMIFAFEFIVNDDKRYSHDFSQEVEDRVSNGLRLFGKYYRGLWD